jgi:AcrR family transcriptional regulator
MVRTAAQLIRRKGVSGTGLREIVVEAGAPRGSLQHYFPGGKEQLVNEALVWMGAAAARRVGRRVGGSPTPGALLEAIVSDWRDDLTRENFAAGCPLLAAASDTASTNEHVRQVVRRAFEAWEAALCSALVDLGVPSQRAESLARVVISALEGAIILCRVRGDLVALDALVGELGPLLDAGTAGAA